MTLDHAQLWSLLLRDFTIIAKTHSDLARHYRAVAGTCRRALDATPADLLPPPAREEDGVACQATLPEIDPFGPWERSHD